MIMDDFIKEELQRKIKEQEQKQEKRDLEAEQKAVARYKMRNNLQ